MSNTFLEKCGNSACFWKTWMKSSWWKRSISVVLEWFEVVLVRIHFLSFSAKLSTQEISSNFKKKSKNAEIGVRETLFLEAWIWSNICQIWMKSGWLERLGSVVLDLFEAVLGEFNFLQFQQIFGSWKFRRISRNFWKFWNWRQRNFIFMGFYTVEYWYLLNWHEKLTVRKIKVCTFPHVLQPFRRTFCAGTVSK